MHVCVLKAVLLHMHVCVLKAVLLHMHKEGKYLLPKTNVHFETNRKRFQELRWSFTSPKPSEAMLIINRIEICGFMTLDTPTISERSIVRPENAPPD